MKILFMGTPDIAAESLRELVKEGFEIVGVVTQPDKPRGRKQIMTPPEVKTEALKEGIAVYQPESLKNGELLPILEELSPDLIAVVAYGKILPQYVLQFPKYGCINMHGSILPKYRGAAPIQWAVINGEKTTGVTTMKMDKGLDTGDMLLSESLEIGEYETSGELFDRMSALGAQVLVKTIKNIDNVKPVPQDNEKSTYAPIITKEMARIDWQKPAREISKLICGMNPWPVAYTQYDDDVIKIFKAEFSNENISGISGEILGMHEGKGLGVKCNGGVIYVKEIQAPGGKRMLVADYLRGHELKSGKIFK